MLPQMEIGKIDALKVVVLEVNVAGIEDFSIGIGFPLVSSLIVSS